MSVTQLRPKTPPQTLAEAFCHVLDERKMDAAEAVVLALDLEAAAKEVLANKFQSSYLHSETVRDLWGQIFRPELGWFVRDIIARKLERAQSNPPGACL